MCVNFACKCATIKNAFCTFIKNPEIRSPTLSYLIAHPIRKPTKHKLANQYYKKLVKHSSSHVDIAIFI